MDREIEWLIERLVEEYPRDLENKRDLLKTRIIWGIPQGFTYWWGDALGPYGGIIIRPVTEELIKRAEGDYWAAIWDFDLKGDTLWVDYAYGPGLYPQMIALCRSTGCPKLGWRHRNRLHIQPMDRMPAKGIKWAFHI